MRLNEKSVLIIPNVKALYDNIVATFPNLREYIFFSWQSLKLMVAANMDIGAIFNESQYTMVASSNCEMLEGYKRNP